MVRKSYEIIFCCYQGENKKTLLPSSHSLEDNCKTAEHWTCFSLIFSFANHIPAQKLRKGNKRVKI